MKTKLFLLTCLFGITFLSAQSKTQNSSDAKEATVFILPQNVIPNGKIISYGPPDPKKRGKSYLIHFEDETVYIVKTTLVMNKNTKGHVVHSAYKVTNDVSTEVSHDLKISISAGSEGMKLVNLQGMIEGTNEWDITFEAHGKHDLKNSYFLDFVEEKGFEVVLNMQQK